MLTSPEVSTRTLHPTVEEREPGRPTAKRRGLQRADRARPPKGQRGLAEPGWLLPPGSGSPGWFAAPFPGLKRGEQGAWVLVPAPWFEAPALPRAITSASDSVDADEHSQSDQAGEAATATVCAVADADGVFVPAFSDATQDASAEQQLDHALQVDPGEAPFPEWDEMQIAELDPDDQAISRTIRPLKMAIAAAGLSLFLQGALLLFAPATGTSSAPTLAPAQAKIAEAERPASSPHEASPAPFTLKATSVIVEAAEASRPEAARRRRPLRLRPTLRSTRRARRIPLTARTLKILQEAQGIYGEEAYARARTLYRRAVRLDPKNDDARFGLALSAFQTGRVREATQQVKRTLALNPDHPEAHILLGFLHQLRRQRQRAIKHYARYLALAPEGEWSMEIRSILATLNPQA